MTKRLSLFVAGLMLVLLGFFVGTGVVLTFATPPTGELVSLAASSVSLPSPVLLTDQEKLISDVYTRVSPSVVSINVATSQGGGSGSGFVFDKQGHIVTNFHVVDDAREIVVNFQDGTIIRAEVVGLDPDSDLAVIKVNLSEDRLFPVTFGSSEDLVVGQTVLALGSPFGERWTLTSGIVSALDRTIRGLNQYSTEQGVSSYSIGAVIQTDAAINPGNSGGPLLTLEGQVIGVNSQIRTESGSNSGIGFAIPGVLVERVARELIENGVVEYSYIGISGGDVGISEIEDLNLPNNQRGVVIGTVAENGPAARAGLRNETGNSRAITSADIILSIDGTPLRGMNDLISYLALNTRPGQTVNLEVLRNGETMTVQVTLGTRSSAS